MDSFPFTNYVVKLEVTGDQLYQALENGVSQTEKVAGRFPQVSGIQYSYNPYLPAGSRIISVTVDGKPLDKTAKYTLATLDFVAGGGDGYSMLKKAKVLLDANGGPLLSKLIIDTIQKDQSISPQTDGRIKVEEELPQDAFVDIKGNSVPAILELKQKGIVHGIDDTHFNPDGFVTRAELNSRPCWLPQCNCRRILLHRYLLLILPLRIGTLLLPLQLTKRELSAAIPMACSMATIKYLLLTFSLFCRKH